MSDLTPCNYCSLQELRRRANANGKRIILAKDEHGWIGAYAVPSLVTDDGFMAMPIGKVDKRTGRSKYWVASFMELP
jgi:hypothetical protein